jgi:hypothetical protein
MEEFSMYIFRSNPKELLREQSYSFSQELFFYFLFLTMDHTKKQRNGFKLPL